MSQPPHPHRSHSPARLAVCLFLVAGAAIAFALWRWHSIDDFVRAIDHGDRLFEDFLRFWRPAGQALLEGRAQDAGYYLTPTFALLMLPCGAMSETAAIVAWGVLEATAALLLFVVPGLLLRRRSPELLAIYAVCFATSVPLLHDLAWGQLSTLLALLSTWASAPGVPTVPASLLSGATNDNAFDYLTGNTLTFDYSIVAANQKYDFSDGDTIDTVP